MSSGLGLNDECLTAFQELKLGKKHKYVVYGINKDKTQIIVVKTSSTVEFEEFLGNLPADDCRWAVYDFEFERPGEGKRNKLIFVSWSPDGASIKNKMVYASSKDVIRKALVGIGSEVQATEPDEISEEAVLDKLLRGK